MKGIIDRFEGDFAVVELEDGIMEKLFKVLLPEGVIEGTVIIIDGDNIYIDEVGTEERRKKSDELLEDLFN